MKNAHFMFLFKAIFCFCFVAFYSSKVSFCICASSVFQTETDLMAFNLSSRDTVHFMRKITNQKHALNNSNNSTTAYDTEKTANLYAIAMHFQPAIMLA